MVLLLLALGFAEPDIAKVTAKEKTDFLKLVRTLPTRGEFFTPEGVKKAEPYLHVLLALDKKDIDENHYFALLALSRGLHDAKKEHRQYAAKHFDKIAHPVLKLSWGLSLFRSSDGNATVTRYLRDSLDDRDRAELMRQMLGPDFEVVRKQILAKSK